MMKQSPRALRLINVALVVAGCVVATFGQDQSELDSTASERIEQARASIVMVKAVDQSNQTISLAAGFFIRKDLIATGVEILDKNSRLLVTVATKAGTLKVLSSGNYFLPYVLLEMPAEVSPLSLADSEQVAVNDSVYMLSDSGQIAAGRVTGTKTIKDTQAFSISIPIDSDNKGAPVFNRNGEVIGIAAKSLDGQSAGLAWPSSLLTRLKHLGEAGVGTGTGDGLRVPDRPAATNTDGVVASSVDTKPVRLNTPAPQYTEAARANRTQGTVILRVLVNQDGNVDAVRVVRGLPDGLTEQAIDVARRSKFKAATKDGKAVAYWAALEMTFILR
jgi:TonB family protein